MQFSQITGLEDIKQHLIASVKNNHVAHAQMFLGKEGYANFALARAYVTYINCENPREDDSCGVCSSCSMMKKLVHPDLHFLFPNISVEQKKKEAHRTESKRLFSKIMAENPYLGLKQWGEEVKAESKQLQIGVDESREVAASISLKSFSGKYKIVIIWLPELMNLSAANAILKILEEPPAKTLFLLVSNDLEKNIMTIRSRCQVVKVRAFNESELLSILKAKQTVSDDELQTVVHLSDGSVVKALELLGNKQSDSFVFFRDWLRACFKNDFAAVLQASEQFGGMVKSEQRQFFVFGNQILREVLVHQAAQTELSRTPETLKEFVTGLAKVMSVEKITGINGLFDEAMFHIGRNANARIVFMDVSFQVSKIIKA